MDETIAKRIIASLFFAIISAGIFADEISVACSPWKPYYYSENNSIQGSAYEVAKSVIEKSGLDAHFTIQPWKRVYESALHKANYMVSCISRTPEREKLFHWIGPVKKETQYNFYKLTNSDITLSSHEDTLNYKVGVLRGSLTEEFMKGLSHQGIHDVTLAEQLVRMLNSGRVDLILEANNVIEEESKLADIDPKKFEMAMVGYGVPTYLALSKKTSMQVVKQIQEAYRSLETEGKLVLR